uniref:Band_3_cyto domain-containing protein n=1 Tax=Globodera pallida TaxID=36090 RepID=A0A183CPQ5_GLOPA
MSEEPTATQERSGEKEGTRDKGGPASRIPGHRPHGGASGSQQAEEHQTESELRSGGSTHRSSTATGVQRKTEELRRTRHGHSQEPPEKKKKFSEYRFLQSNPDQQPMDNDDSNDLEQLMFDELGDEAEDQKPERRVTIDESDNESDWRNDLHLSESSEEEDNGKEDQKEEEEPARKERSPAAKHARVLPPARCGGCGLIGHSQGDAMKCPKVNPRRRAEMDTKKAKTYADRARKGTQPAALPVICSSAKRAAKAGGIAAAQATERMSRDVACALSRAAEVESRYKRIGTALRESVSQFAQTAQMMAEAAKRMGEVLEAMIPKMRAVLSLGAKKTQDSKEFWEELERVELAAASPYRDDSHAFDKLHQTARSALSK